MTTFTSFGGQMRIDGKRLVFQRTSSFFGMFESKWPEQHIPIRNITSASVVSNAGGNFIHILTPEFTGVFKLDFRSDQMEEAQAFHRALLAAIDNA